MTGEMKLALSLSIGLHVGLLTGLPGSISPARFDVERAPTSLEIFVLAPSQPAVTVEPRPALASTPVPEPVHEPEPQTIISDARQGALSEVLPSYLRNPAPVYPQRARERGHEGRVLVRVRVLPTGRAGGVDVAGSSGHELLDQAAARAISQWKFKPALRGGQPVAVEVEIPVVFRLTE